MRAYTHARDWCRVSRERRAGLHIEDAQEFADHMRASVARELDALRRLLAAAGVQCTDDGAAAILRICATYY